MSLSELHASFAANFLHPLAQGLRGNAYPRVLLEARRNLSLSRGEIRELQFTKLKALLNHAVLHVPYYRELFSQKGIQAEDIRSWDDFEKLPVLTKTEVRQHNKRFLSEKPRSRLRKYRTSGSTGTPLKVFTSEIAIAGEYACQLRAYHHWGIKLGDRQIRFLGGHRSSIDPGLQSFIKRRIYRQVKNLIFNRRFFYANYINEAELERQWQFLKNYRPVYLSGFPSSLYFLAQYIKDKGYDGRYPGIELIISGGEVIFDWQQSVIMDIFGCPIMDVYGSYEIGIAACSYPCGGMHINDDYVIVEVIKKKPGEESGHIVATRLDNWEFPLLRFDVGDLAYPLEEHQDCTLGIALSVTRKIIGRQFDQIHFSNGRVLHGAFLSFIMKKAQGVHQYQIIQRSPDLLEILIVMDKTRFSSEQKEYITGRIKSLAGNVEVIFTPVDSLKTEDSGKFRFIRSDSSHTPGE
jgi:phenylacetate-CoA ligase